jgi:hypothetical protein
LDGVGLNETLLNAIQRVNKAEPGWLYANLEVIDDDYGSNNIEFPGGEDPEDSDFMELQGGEDSDDGDK